MERYEKYKDSGVEWIGEVPEHWEVKRLRHLAQIFGRIGYRGYKTSDLVQKGEGAITLSPSNMKEFNMDFSECTYLSWEKYEESPEIMISQGDILFVKTGSTYGKSSFVESLPEKSTINPQIIVLKNIECHSKLLWYILKSSIIQYQVETTVVGGTIPTISQTKVNNYAFPIVLNTTEQTTIVNYLDRKTAEIDQLIADKKRLITLYEEEKTALINQAVTKGINPEVKMKDSGIEWLGEVPEHWEVKKIKHLTQKIGSGITPSGGANVYQTSGIPLLRSQNVHFDGLKLDDVAFISEEIHESMKNSKVYCGDVLLNITGASIGRAYFVEDWLGEANVNQHVCILRPKENLDSLYLYFVLRSNIGQEQIRREQTGSGREGLNFEVLKNFFIPFLNLQEQKAIVNMIKDRCDQIDNQIAKTQKLIDLLNEYRTALISEVVTGKVKVTS